jgi:D-beta-D-heptose 7-phosphate kinase/D-beta-D-heptose 1-phosphate adenosyltransferase
VLLQKLQAAQVHCNFETVTTHPTITKLRVISRHQQLLRMDFEEAFSAQDSAALAARAQTLFSHVGVIVLSDYNKGALLSADKMIAAARAANKLVLVDPKGTDFSRYRGATLLTPNLHEFETVMGACVDESDLVQKGQQLMRDLDLQALLITRGEHGMTLLQMRLENEQHQELHLPAQAREVFDVTGAGDTVIATLRYCIGRRRFHAARSNACQYCRWHCSGQTRYRHSQRAGIAPRIAAKRTVRAAA